MRAKYGVKSIALFGSVARNEAAGTSDVDVLVEFERPVDLFDLVDLQLHLQSVLGVKKVDAVMRDSLYPALRDNILGGAIDVDREALALRH